MPEKKINYWKYMFFVLLGLVAVTCYVTYGILDKSFIKLQFQRIFPLGYVEKKEKIISNEALKPKLLLAGDSRIQMWPNNYLADYFNVINIGHGGQTSSQVAMQLETISIPSGRFAFVQICINDLHSLQGFEKLSRYIIEQCKRNISRITQRLREKGYTVILSTLFPPNTPPLNRLFYWPANFEQLFSEINLHIANSASENVLVFDSFSMLKKAGEPYLDEKFVDNDFFLHVNNEAYFQLSKELSEVLLQLEKRHFKQTER